MTTQHGGEAYARPVYTADLTDEEIDRICAPLIRQSAQMKFLRGLGLHVVQKPNGRPLVARVNWDMVVGKVPVSLHPELVDRLDPEPQLQLDTEWHSPRGAKSANGRKKK